MPLFAEAPWSTCPVTVIVPETPPSALCGEMLALEAELKPAKPRVIALSTDGSSPRYAFIASSLELTPPPHAAIRSGTTRIEDERIFHSVEVVIVPSNTPE